MTLIFKRTLIEKIRRLEKTANRRASRPNVKEGGIYRLRVDYKGSLPDRISVKRLHTQSLGSMTQEDVRKEGFKSLEEFMDNWVELYGSWDREHIVWVVEFEYLGTVWTSFNNLGSNSIPIEMVNPNVLSLRYSTPEMNAIFSEEGKTVYERDLWLAVLRAQKELGLDIPQSAIDDYEKARCDVDLDLIKEIERRTRHDVKAKIEAYSIAAGGVEYVHMGMTSRDLTDNVEQLQIRKAGHLVLGKYVSVLRHLLEKAEEYKGIEIAARTHHQAAQPTLLGRRFAMWAEELNYHILDFEDFTKNYPLRGIKGPVGTQFDMVNLLGSAEKAEKLEWRVAEELGFSRILVSPGQVYPRSLDYKLVSHLAALAATLESFAKTLRLMAGHELVTEGFKEGQVGSSVMPHKMNTRSTERMCAFSHMLKMYADGASRIAGDQWEEGDVSCSALRRIIIPDAFYASDGLLETALTVLNEMGAYPAVIEKELDRYLPFLATTGILGIALKHGVGREKAHEIIRKHAVSEALRMREEGAGENKLVSLLAEDPEFKAAGITMDEIKELIDDKTRFVGNAERQIDAVKKKAQDLLTRYADEAMYEPREIL